MHYRHCRCRRRPMRMHGRRHWSAPGVMTQCACRVKGYKRFDHKSSTAVSLGRCCCIWHGSPVSYCDHFTYVSGTIWLFFLDSFIYNFPTFFLSLQTWTIYLSMLTSLNVQSSVWAFLLKHFSAIHIVSLHYY